MISIWKIFLFSFLCWLSSHHHHSAAATTTNPKDNPENINRDIKGEMQALDSYLRDSLNKTNKHPLFPIKPSKPVAGFFPDIIRAPGFPSASVIGAYLSNVIPAYFKTSQACSDLTVYVGVLINRIRQKGTEKDIEGLVMNMCVLSRKPPLVCSGFIKRFTPTFYYIVQQRTDLTPEIFVGTVFQQLGCRTNSSYVEWSINDDDKSNNGTAIEEFPVESGIEEETTPSTQEGDDTSSDPSVTIAPPIIIKTLPPLNIKFPPLNQIIKTSPKTPSLLQLVEENDNNLIESLSNELPKAVPTIDSELFEVPKKRPNHQGGSKRTTPKPITSSSEASVNEITITTTTTSETEALPTQVPNDDNFIVQETTEKSTTRKIVKPGRFSTSTTTTTTESSTATTESSTATIVIDQVENEDIEIPEYPTIVSIVQGTPGQEPEEIITTTKKMRSTTKKRPQRPQTRSTPMSVETTTVATSENPTSTSTTSTSSTSTTTSTSTSTSTTEKTTTSTTPKTTSTSTTTTTPKTTTESTTSSTTTSPSTTTKDPFDELDLGAILEPPRALKILHLTDIHVDPLYSVGANAACENKILCCHKEDGVPANRSVVAGLYGSSKHCDSPMLLLEETLKFISQNHSDIDLLYMSGDLIPHNMWYTTRPENAKTIEVVSSVFRSYLPNTKIIPILGNHEPHPVNMFNPGNVPSHLSTRGIFSTTYNSWMTWIPAESADEYLRHGHYTMKIRENFRVLVMNTNLCFGFNFWQLYNSNEYREQLRWLREQLQKAVEEGARVHILGHTPPGYLGCNKVYSRNYYKVISNYSSIIKAQFFGHLHVDSFRIYFNPLNNVEPINLQWISPSLTPYGSNNPAFKIYHVDPIYLDVIDYETYVMDLDKSNSANEPKWLKLYSAVEAYDTPDVRLYNINALLDKLTKNNQLFDTYFQYYQKAVDKFQVSKCDTYCKKKMLCRIVRPYFGAENECDRLQLRFDGIIIPLYDEYPVF